MGRKKKTDGQHINDINETIQPWCYYCDREFDNEAVVIQHQKSKHFRCIECGKKMTTLGALVTHLRHVHKENLKKVPNAREGRDATNIEVYGMQGIPEEFLTSSAPPGKRQRIHGNDDDSGNEGDVSKGKSMFFF